MEDIQSFVNYYAREGYARHIQSLCNEQLKKRGDDPILIFWRAFSLMKESLSSEAIRELESIHSKELKLAVTAALIEAHQLAKLVDRERVEELTASYTIDETSTNEKGLLLTANFYWLWQYPPYPKSNPNNLDKARDLINRVLESQPQYGPALTLRGWIDLSSDREAHISKSIQSFDNVLKTGATANPKDRKGEIDALLGKAKYLETKKQYSLALDIINQAVIQYPWFFSKGSIEKVKLLLAMQEWDQAHELVQKIINQEPANIFALQILTLIHLAREGRHVIAANRIGDLMQAIDKQEPRNGNLYYKVARPFARLAGRNPAVLHQTLALIDRARALSQENSDFVTECAYEQSLMSNASALASYRLSLKLDESNVNALYGIIRCQILDSNFDEAEQQLEFLNEIQVAAGKTAEVAYLTALLVWRKNKNREKSISLLTEAVDSHFKSLKGLTMGIDYFTKFNPDFLLDIAKEYLTHCPSDPLDPADPAPNVLTTVVKLLEIIVRAVPGFLECQYLLGKAKFFMNEDDSAQQTLSLVLKMYPAYSEAHMLEAQIFLKKDQPKQASASLELALSHNFEVREWPLFHLLKAIIHEKLGELDESVKVLTQAMLLPGVRTGIEIEESSPKKEVKLKDKKKTTHHAVSIKERATIFIQLAVSLYKKGAFPESEKIMQEAIDEFRDTQEEMRVVLANADLALKRGDVEQALGLLSVARPEKPYYIQAQNMMATIHLVHRNDKNSYISCFRNISDQNPGVHSYLLLGDAYMRIQEPDQAVSVYEEALKENPKDSGLASKIGKALITTHEYAKAIDYYETAMKSDPSKTILIHDLASLYTRLKKFDHADKVLSEVLDKPKTYPDINSITTDVKFYLLRSKVAEGNLNHPKAVEALSKAHDLQNILLGRIKGEQPEFVRQQREVAANICFQLAEHLQLNVKNIEKAQGFYNRALQHDDSHEKSILALAKICLARNELDNCQQQCVTLLRMDPGNEEASIMLADLMFRKGEYDAATFHFQQLLERRPNHYDALNRLILLLRRAGRLSEVPRFLTMAENLSTRASIEPGLHYCKGIYHRYTNNPREALAALYQARHDGEWGRKAMINMIEIYLNPDNEAIFSLSEDEELIEKNQPVNNTQALNSARELLKELLKDGKSTKAKVLECYLLMYSKNRQNIEQALQTLVNIINNPSPENQKNTVGALLGVAYGYILLKQNPKARNQLKRIAKMSYNVEDADDFERGWLLLADMYIQGGKYDLSQELLKRCLNYNRSCSKAWELMGFIMEKEQSHKEAAENYEAAWRMENESNPVVGYKLAFNYLKAKRCVEAIDICHKVLTMNPNYPKIKKEVLDRARASLKP